MYCESFSALYMLDLEQRALSEMAFNFSHKILLAGQVSAVFYTIISNFSTSFDGIKQ
jgi:hypothetical protein